MAVEYPQHQYGVMRTLIVTEFITADGVIDSPGGGDHPRAGWSFKEVPFDAAAYELKGSEQQESGALLLGRVSYQEFAPVWPSMVDEFPLYNAMPKYVVSTTLTETDPGWSPTTILRSLDDVAELKQGDGQPIIVHGSATLAKALLAAGLVDRYHLLVFPILLGSGKRLFDDKADLTRLTLVEHAAYENGIVKAIYDVAPLESFGDLPDRGEAAVPLGAERVELPRGGAELRPDHPVAHLATHPHRLDQADLLQHGEVLRDRLPRDREPPRQGRRGCLALTERRQDAPPGLVTERREHRDQRRRSSRRRPRAGRRACPARHPIRRGDPRGSRPGRRWSRSRSPRP